MRSLDGQRGQNFGLDILYVNQLAAINEEIATRKADILLIELDARIGVMGVNLTPADGSPEADEVTEHDYEDTDYEDLEPAEPDGDHLSPPKPPGMRALRDDPVVTQI